VVSGDNGHGKTNLVEAIGVLSSFESFRGAPTAAMVRVGHNEGVVRGRVQRGERELLVELELSMGGRSRAQVNKQKVARRADLAEGLLVSVFAPDDLELVKGSPGIRRLLLDDTLSQLSPRYDAVRSTFERALRQRNALLKSAKGRLDADATLTLDVWDDRLGAAGTSLGELRRTLWEDLAPMVGEAYSELADVPGHVSGTIVTSWGDDLPTAFAQSRVDDVRRGVTTVGPHRDDVSISLGGLPSRTHASQGEQRTLALALRLAAHRRLASEVGHTPVLVLDDVFSELDHRRAAALLGALPEGQVIITSAVGVPAGVQPDDVLTIERSGNSVIDPHATDSPLVGASASVIHQQPTTGGGR